MSDQDIITAFEKLHRLHSTSGEAVGQFAAIGAIREVIFRPGSVIFVAYERDAREARDAVKLLGDPKATALMDEIVNLTQRMIQFEAALPPVRPDSRNLKRRHTDYNATAMSTPPSPCKLSLAGVALYLGSGTLWNYLGRTVPRPELHVKNPYALSQPELREWCKWNGLVVQMDVGHRNLKHVAPLLRATSDGDIEALIDKVTRYLSTLCRLE